jgi:hypothetical protein
MVEKYLNYVGELMTDVDYVASGYPKDFLEVKVEQALPFRFYCSMQANDWEEVTSEQRNQLIKQLKDKKSIYSKSDHSYYMLDFYLASLGGL